MNPPGLTHVKNSIDLSRTAKLLLQPIPRPLLKRAITLGLNHSFRPYTQGNDLSFLHHKQVMIDVSDINLCFSITLVNNRLAVELPPQSYDVCFKSTMSDLVAIILGKVDPDTLFFRRRLAISGDTELGLSLKNFLDTLEPKTLLPTPVYTFLETLPIAQ